MDYMEISVFENKVIERYIHVDIQLVTSSLSVTPFCFLCF